MKLKPHIIKRNAFTYDPKAGVTRKNEENGLRLILLEKSPEKSKSASDETLWWKCFPCRGEQLSSI